jgi:hypothetical protein
VLQAFKTTQDFALRSLTNEIYHDLFKLGIPTTKLNNFFNTFDIDLPLSRWVPHIEGSFIMNVKADLEIKWRNRGLIIISQSEQFAFDNVSKICAESGFFLGEVAYNVIANIDSDDILGSIWTGEYPILKTHFIITELRNKKLG